MSWQLIIFDVSGTLLDGLDAGELYPGALEFVQAAHRKGIDLALASNLGRGSLQKFVHNYGLTPYVQVAVSADDAAFKPAPDMIELVLSLTGYTADAALMVGDSASDMQAARAARVTTCAALWGGEDPRLAAVSPRYKVKNFNELAHLVGVDG